MAGKEGNIKVSIQGVEKKYNTRKGEVVALNGVILKKMNLFV